MKKNNSFLKIINLESVDSTNDYAVNLACDGFSEIVVVRANTQTKGKGRRGNDWASPSNKGIYASFLLKPPNPLAEIVFLPIIFSLAISQTLGDAIVTAIKWPNDLMAGDKKIAGVLVEAKSLQEKVDFVIAGVGININSEKKELPECATSLYIETGKTYDIEDFFKAFTTKAINLYNDFKKGNIKTLLDKLDPDLKQETLNKSSNANEVMILR